MPLLKFVQRVSGLTFLLPAIAFAHIPIAEVPEWVAVPKENKEMIEYEAKGVYTKGDYTYVILREIRAKEPSKYKYVFTVHAFNCSKNSASVAMMGQMALDGSTGERGNMNDERLLAKYSSQIPVPEHAYLTPVHAAVCRK